VQSPASMPKGWTAPAAAPALTLALALSLGPAEAAVPSGTPLLITLPPNALAIDVGAGGFVVVGSLYPIGGLTWLPTSGTTLLGGTQAVAVSRDGKTIVGRALDSNGKENAAIWTGGRDWRLLGSFTPTAQPCDMLLSGSFGASDDGKVVVGLGWDGCKLAHAFRWEESTGMVDLGSTTPGRSSRANNVSGDGQVVVGWQEDTTGYRMGAKWAGRTQELIRGPGGMVGEAFGANHDGSLIVGTNCNPFDVTGSPTGWSWTAAGGVTCLRFDVPPRLQFVPRQVLIETTSDDGRVMGGGLSFGLESESLVWFDGQGFLLKDYLRAHGVPDAFDGWVNTGFVLGMTPDGRTLVGYGAGPTSFQGFMVVLPELGSK
jgi:probable HAF family extracellular repeat protein